MLTNAPVFLTNRPAEARVLDAALGLWLKKYEEAGYLDGPVPAWVFAMSSELHTLAYGDSEPLGTAKVLKQGRPAMLTVMETAERLGVTTKTVNKWCRSGDLVAIRRGRFWQVDSRSVDERNQSR